MNINDSPKLIQYAFFTAIATTVYFVESIAVRALPLPFLRIGLANVIIVYLLMQRRYGFAFVVNILKTLIGGLFSFTLMSPATLLSISGGIGAFLIMWLLLVSRINFSVIGISIAGAVVHNIIQLLCVRWVIIPRNSVFNLMPLLILIGIGTGFVTGIIAHELSKRLRGNPICES